MPWKFNPFTRKFDFYKAPAWELIEEKEITSPVQQVDFLNVDGEKGIFFKLLAIFKNEAGVGCEYLLQPNLSGVSTHRVAVGTNWDGATITEIHSQEPEPAGFHISYVDSGCCTFAYAYFYLKTSLPRLFIVDHVAELEAGVCRANRRIVSLWPDTTTQITSLRIYATQANGIGVGSIISLFGRAT